MAPVSCSSRRLPVLLALALALAAALPPAGASANPLPLGALTPTAETDPQVPPGAASRGFSVRCPGVSGEARGFLALRRPAGPARGVALFFRGGPGVGYWSKGSEGAVAFLEGLVRDGLIVVEVSWRDSWLVSPTGEIGPARLGCRPATVVRWAHAALYRPLRLRAASGGACGFCITGNSGGASQVSYALSHYGLDAILDAVVPTGGPPHAALAKGCVRNAGERQYWFARGAASTIDRSYGFLERGTGPCARNDASFVPRWLADAVDTGGSDYVHPQTRVVFLFGESDATVAVPHGRDYAERLLAAGSPSVVVRVVADTGHSILTPGGLAALREALLPPGGTPAAAPPTAPPALRIAAFVRSPKAPRAGRRFTAGVRVTAPGRVRLSPAAVRCAARIAGRRVPLARTVVAPGRRRVARCVWHIPPRAAGKLLRGSISVRYRGASAERRFALRIRR